MTQPLPEVCITSGGDTVRLRSPLNHKVYATRAGFDYRLEVGPYPGLHSRYYFKLAAVRNMLRRYDWVIWLDDDAFITDFGRNTFSDQIAAADQSGSIMVIANSPVNAAGEWTRINSGVFVIKRDERAFALLDLAMSIAPSGVQSWWRPNEHGRLTVSDQDTLLWAIDTGGYSGVVTIVEHEVFNSRPHHYQSGPQEHFVCHFPGVPDKRAAISEFGRRFDLDDTLIPADLRAEFGISAGRLMSQRELLVTSARRRVGRSLRQPLRALSEQ